MPVCVYITAAGDDKLGIYRMQEEDGGLSLLAGIDVSARPGPLLVAPRRRRLYVGLRGSQEIACYAIGGQGAHLEQLGRVALTADPCYLSTDRRGRFLLSAYYGAGKITVHELGEDGTVASLVTEIPTAQRAHCIRTDPTNRFVFVPHTAGPNLIFQFRFDGETGTLTPNDPPRVTPGPGEGPRHYEFHPHLDILYTSNEQGSSVTAYALDPNRGTLTSLQTVSTLPDDYDGDNTCAQIHIHPSGRWLYVSNRGHDSIAHFAVNGQSGRLRALGQQPTEPTPRVFNLDPEGRYLYVAGQGSGRLAAYRIDEEDGGLEPLTTYSVGDTPMWVELVRFDD